MTNVRSLQYHNGKREGSVKIRSKIRKHKQFIAVVIFLQTITPNYYSWHTNHFLFFILKQLHCSNYSRKEAITAIAID